MFFSRAFLIRIIITLPVLAFDFQRLFVSFKCPLIRIMEESVLSCTKRKKYSGVDRQDHMSRQPDAVAAAVRGAGLAGIHRKLALVRKPAV